MSFGFTNTQATFQSLMNDVLREHLLRFILVFFYDILVYSASKTNHLYHLQVVFQILQDQQLYANAKKCVFTQPTIEYLGHIIHEEGVSVDPCKVQAMLHWPLPPSLKALRGFLGYERMLSSGLTKLRKPRKENTALDALSRLPVGKTLATISVTFVMDFEQLEERVAADPFLANIIRVITTNPTAYPHFQRLELPYAIRDEWSCLLPQTSFNSYNENSTTAPWVAMEGFATPQVRFHFPNRTTATPTHPSTSMGGNLHGFH